MTSVRRWGCPAQRDQATKASTGPSSNRSDDGDYEDHKNPLGSNKPRPFKAPTKPSTTPPQACPLLVLHNPGAKWYSQQNLDKIIQTFLHISKGGSRDKLKVKTLDVYHSRSHMECYNFCQQCEDNFATCRATKPNRIPFAASFLRNRINFCWKQHK